MIAKVTRAHLRFGVRSFEDIRIRCRIDDTTGCWLWSLCIGSGNTPKVGIPAGVLSEREQVMSAAKAAWLLSGRKLPDGHVVWRKHCGDSQCINPEHCVSLLRAEMRRACAATGREKGNAERRAKSLANAAKFSLRPEAVRAVEERLKRVHLGPGMSRAITLTLPYPLSANRYWRSFTPKGHKRAVVTLSDEAKAYKEQVSLMAWQQGCREPIEGRVAVHLALYPNLPLDWAKRSKRDPLGWDDTVQCIDLDNARKVLYDSLKGVAFGDDKWVRKDSGERMTPDEHGARVVVTIIEVLA